MQISHISISNFRSIQNLEMDFKEVTALLGSNNAGKSSVLKALQIFFEAAPRISNDDYYRREAGLIEISLRFSYLTPAEIAEFGSAVIDNSLQVTRTFSRENDGDNLQYSVTALAFPEFEAIRNENGAVRKREIFNELADRVPGLARANSANAVVENMEAWEAQNPDRLVRTPIRGFFGAPNVASGKLKKKTSIHYVPAVADAAEETSAQKKSPIIVLLSDIAKQVYENQRKVRDFIERASVEFNDLVSPDKFSQLADISGQLTRTIRRYYQDSSLLANWEAADGIQVQFPKPTIKIEDNGFVSGLENVGHGLQRAAFFSVIEFLASQNPAIAEDDAFEEAQSDIILLVEEPEIYQHPAKQQVIYEAFHEICRGFSEETGIRFQIIFSTHSEKFIGMNKFHSARILRRGIREGIERHDCSSVDINETSRYFAELKGVDPLSDEAFEAKMHIFSRELCEGFFASKVILVEGVSDKAVLQGAYHALGRNPDREGIAIISTDGKTKIDKPLYIFRQLGIPVYVVFDSDMGKEKEKDQKVGANITIQKILGIPEPDRFPDGCFEFFSAYAENMESYLKRAAPEKWERYLEKYREEFGFDAADICKTPWVISGICEALQNDGVDISRFRDVIGRVDAM